MFRKYVLGIGWTPKEKILFILITYPIAALLGVMLHRFVVKLDERREFMRQLGYLHSDGLQA